MANSFSRQRPMRMNQMPCLAVMGTALSSSSRPLLQWPMTEHKQLSDPCATLKTPWHHMPSKKALHLIGPAGRQKNLKFTMCASVHDTIIPLCARNVLYYTGIPLGKFTDVVQQPCLYRHSWPNNKIPQAVSGLFVQHVCLQKAMNRAQELNETVCNRLRPKFERVDLIQPAQMGRMQRST